MLDILRVLDATAAPRGAEAAAAEALGDWCSGRWPGIEWTVQRYGSGGANLIGRHRVSQDGAAGVLLYSHLDTSLDGGPGDAGVTGRADPPEPLRVRPDGTVDGFGLGVARAPAAAALLGFAELADPSAGATLLLAGSGTHRLAPGSTERPGVAERLGSAERLGVVERLGSAERLGVAERLSSAERPGSAGETGPTGVEAYLAGEPRPTAAVVAKAGPSGVLWSEPGAAYLRVRLSGRQGAVLARRVARPDGGVIAHAGLIIAAIESWRLGYLAGREDPSGQIGPELGIGSIRAGRWDKPDLLPAALELGLYLVTMPGDDVLVLAQELAQYLRSAMALGPLGECGIEVRAQPVDAAAATDEQAPIVSQAKALWAAEFGAVKPIQGWTGSTDGVLLRGQGIDTVRLGPQIKAASEDPRRDHVDLAELARWPPIYAALL